MTIQNPTIQTPAEKALRFHTAVPDPLFRSYLGSVAGVYTLDDLLSLSSLSLSQLDLEDVSGIDYARTLTFLYLGYNQLTTVDVAPLVNLTFLRLDSNQLTTVDVAPLVNLTSLYLGENQLTTIDVTPLVNLTYLHVARNQLTTIDVTPLVNLTDLYLYKNELTTIDVTPLVNLANLYLYNSQLTTIDVAPLVNLKKMYLYGNQLTTVALETVIDDLYNNRLQLGANSCIISLNDNPGSVDAAISKSSEITAIRDAGCDLAI